MLRITGRKESDGIIKHETSHERYRRAHKKVKEGALSLFVEMLYAGIFYREDPGKFQSKTQNKFPDVPEESLDQATKDAVKIADDIGYVAAHQ